MSAAILYASCLPHTVPEQDPWLPSVSHLGHALLDSLGEGNRQPGVASGRLLHGHNPGDCQLRAVFHCGGRVLSVRSGRTGGRALGPLCYLGLGGQLLNAILVQLYQLLQEALLSDKVRVAL